MREKCVVVYAVLMLVVVSGSLAFAGPYFNNAPEEVIERTYNDLEGKWQDDTKTVRTYDGAGRLIEEVFYDYDADYVEPWFETQKVSRTYSPAGNLEEEIEYNYVYNFFEEIWEWEENTNIMYSYNTEGKVSEIVEYTYDIQYGWNKQEKYTYTYDTDGNVSEVVYYDNYNSGEEKWEEDSKTVYTYDIDGNLTEEIMYDDTKLNDRDGGSFDPDILFLDLNQDGDWDSGEDIWYEVMVNGRYDAGTDTQIYDNGDGWGPLDGDTGDTGGLRYYETSGNGNWDSTEYVWYNQDGNGTFDMDTDILLYDSTSGAADWQEDTRYTYTYDVDGNVSDQTFYWYNAVDGQWVPNMQNTNTYDVNGYLTEQLLSGYAGLEFGTGGSNDNRIRFTDSDSDGEWDAGEPIWYDENNNDVYDTTVDTQIYDNGDGWDPDIGDGGDSDNRLLFDDSDIEAADNGDGWDPNTGTVGISDSKLLFQDLDVNGFWDKGEDIWYDDLANGQFDLGIDTPVEDNNDGWDPLNTTTGVSDSKLIFEDNDDSNTWDLGEDIWYDEDGNGVYDMGIWDAGEDIWFDVDDNGDYDAGIDIQVFDNGDGWDPQDGDPGDNDNDLLFADADEDGNWDSGEDIWYDENGNNDYDESPDYIIAGIPIVGDQGSNDEFRFANFNGGGWDPTEDVWYDENFDGTYDQGVDISIINSPAVGDQGSSDDFFFEDLDGDGNWDPGEDIWYDVSGPFGRYDDGGDTQVFANGDGWDVQDGVWGDSDGALIFDDQGGGGGWDAGEPVWYDDGNDEYELDTDTQVYDSAQWRNFQRITITWDSSKLSAILMEEYDIEIEIWEQVWRMTVTFDIDGTLTVNEYDYDPNMDTWVETDQRETIFTNAGSSRLPEFIYGLRPSTDDAGMGFQTPSPLKEMFWQIEDYGQFKKNPPKSKSGGGGGCSFDSSGHVSSFALMIILLAGLWGISTSHKKSGIHAAKCWKNRL